MPLTQISLRNGKSVEYRQAPMEQVYLAMRESIAIPEDDRFATVTELDSENLNNSGSYAGVERTDDVVLIQITLKLAGRLKRRRRFTQALPNVLRLTPAFAWKTSSSASLKWPKKIGH